MSICPSCKRKVKENDRYCENCGTKLEVIDTLCVDIHKVIDQKQGEKMIHCSKCGQEIESDSKFCKYCGSPVENINNPNLIDCPECGHPVSRKAASCPNCGHPFAKNQTKTTTQVVNNSSGIGFWGVVFAIIVAIFIISFC